MRAEDNDYLTRVGPGTPMGALMRRYWLPVAKSSELEAGGAPVRMRILGENLLGFRTPEGVAGLIDHRCKHRCASLAYGRNEEGGIRCIYHGWKFDPTGQCIDMPSEPAETEFAARVRIPAAAVIEKFGVVWAYLGGERPAPPFPEFDLDCVPEDQIEVTFLHRSCNWLQGLDGDIDTVHVGFLHLGGVGTQNFEKGSTNFYRQANLTPKYDVVDTPYGTMYSGYRPAGEGQLYHRVAQVLFPTFTMAPQDPLGFVKLRCWLPLDDENSMLVIIDGPKPASQAVDKEGKRLPGFFGDGEVLPHDGDWLGRYRLKESLANNHMQSRDLMRTLNYSGIMGGRVQDQAVVESMGPIVDRTYETLGTSDQMVVRTRRRLLKAARALAEEGIPPPGSDDASLYRSVRSGFITLPESTDWLAAFNAKRREWSGGTVPELQRA